MVKNALEIPVICEELNVNTPLLFVDSLVICSEIVNNESERLTEEILGSGNSEYKNPELSFFIDAAPIKISLKFPFVIFPLKTPGTLVIEEMDTDVPSAETETTLLNISVVVNSVPIPITSPSRRAIDKEF